ncbi:hypothetical protein ACI2T7_03555 [Ralstonia nicotianae]
MDQYEVTEDEAAFYQWWDENYAPAFATMPGALQSAFVEIAQNTWMAATKRVKEST